MTVRSILTIGDPALRFRAEEVDPASIASPEVQAVVDDLVDTMRAASGAGLAATQIGVPLRVCAIEVRSNLRYPYKPDIPLTVLVNPVLEPLASERFENNEGCLSVPGLRGNVWRYTELRVEGFDRHGGRVETEVRGLSAGTFQHEVDHLDGVLFVDRVEDTSTLATWEQWERHHRAAFVQRVERLVARYGS
jgi:peptide deformylase